MTLILARNAQILFNNVSLSLIKICPTFSGFKCFWKGQLQPYLTPSALYVYDLTPYRVVNFRYAILGDIMKNGKIGESGNYIVT